jgi:hypothetical protein
LRKLGGCVDVEPPVHTSIGLRLWIPVPARGDHDRGALVPAVRLSYRDVEESSGRTSSGLLVPVSRGSR